MLVEQSLSGGEEIYLRFLNSVSWKTGTLHNDMHPGLRNKSENRETVNPKIEEPKMTGINLLATATGNYLNTFMIVLKSLWRLWVLLAAVALFMLGLRMIEKERKTK
jgi:hypothetical protein